MAGLNFDITADNTNIKAKLEETQRKISQMAGYAEKEGENLDKVFNNIGKSIAAIGIGFSAQEIGQQILQVRGEFQQLEVAFNTILGSEEKATELMSQMVETAATTPFDLQSVASGAKQLLAFGESAEKVNDDLVMLGNIASGLSIPLSDIVYLYGTTMTQGRLYTEDFNQFVGRGIPLIKELAKEFGVAEGEVKGLVEAGRVGFPEIQKVLQNLTSEGGMFYNLMAEQSKTISGQISNIGDSFSMMLNDIGKANEGVINDALGGVSYLLENYEAIGKTILELVSAYGAYKAILITLTALHKAYGVVLQQAALEQSLAAAAGTTLSASQARVAASTKLLTISMKSLNSVLLANPYAAVTAAVVALGYGIYKLSTYQTDYEKGVKSLGNSYKEYNEQVSSEQRQLAGLYGQLSALKKGTSEYNEVKEQIIKGYSKYYSGLADEIEAVGLTEEAYRKLTQAIDQSFGARQYKKFSEEQMGLLDETTAENLEKIQNRLVDKLGDEAGNRYYAKIREAIFTGSVKNINGTSNLVGLDNDTENALKKVSNIGFGFSNKAVEQYIANILNAQKLTEKLDKEAKRRFGISDAEILPDSKKTEEEAKNNNKSLSEVISMIKETEKNIVSLRKKASEGLISTTDVDTAIAELDTLKKKYKSMTGEDYGNKKAQQQAIKDQKDLNNQLIELKKKNEDEKIAIEKEGSERQIAEIKLRYERELQTIEELEEKLKKVQGGILTSDQQKIIDNAKSISEKKYKSETSKVTSEELENEKQALQEYYIQYGDYWEKRKNLAQKYQDLIAKATTKGEKMSLEREATESLAALDDEAQKTTSVITQLFTDMSEKSAEQIRELAKQGQELLDFIGSGTYKKDNAFGITEEQFKVLSESPEELDRIKKAIKGLYEEADKVEPSFTKIKNLLKDIFNSGGDNSKLEEWLNELNGEVNKVMQSVSFLSDTFAKLGESFGSNTLSGISDGLNVAIGAVDSAMKGAQSGAMFGPIGASAGAAIGLVSSLASSIAQIHDKKNEKQIQELQNQIDLLTDSYDDLRDKIEDAYSKDASNLIEQQNELLEQQKVLIQQQIKEEEDKKKTDNDRIKEWQQQIDDINDQIQDNKESAIDAIFGEDLRSAINNFADALTNAWSEGTDASISAKDTVKKMMQQMVTESIKAAIQASGSMEEIRKKLQEFYVDNVLTGWEQDYIYNMAEELQKEIDKQFGWSEDLFKEEDTSKGQQQASSKGFETMSQDTANELNGRFTAMYEVDLYIRDAILSVVSYISLLSITADQSNITLSEIRNLMITNNNYLYDMSLLQKKIYNFLVEKLASIDSNIKNVL